MAILTLADAKAQLNITDSSSDAELQVYVDSVAAAIEHIVGPVETRSVTEVVDGYETLCLRQPPVVSVTSVTSIYPGGPTWATGLLFLDGELGVVRRIDRAGFSFGPFTVVYQAGRGSVPPAINLAARIVLAHLWETQRGSRGRTGIGMTDVTPVPGFGYMMPNQALALLEPFARISGIA